MDGVIYSAPKPVRDLQQAAQDLSILDGRCSDQRNTMARQILASAQNIANSVMRACSDTKTAEVHAFVTPVLVAAGAAISRYTELLRIDGGSSSKTVAVLDWLTVNTNGNKSTTLKAFSSALEALEGMLQIDNDSAQIIINPRKAHELACVDPIHDLCVPWSEVISSLTFCSRTARWLATPDSFSEFRKVLEYLDSTRLGGIREFKELLHLLLTTLTILRRAPNVFERLLGPINRVIRRCLQPLSTPSQKPRGGIWQILNELASVVVKLRLVEAIGQVAEFADLSLLAANLVQTATPVPSASEKMLSAVPMKAPVKLHDRDLLVFQVASAIIKGIVPALPVARVPICGAAGIGKTAVANAVFHHKRITSAFRSNRIFVSCDELSDIDDLIAALEMNFIGQISRDSMSMVVAHLRERPNTLLVLDGFDSERLCNTASDLTTMTMVASGLNSLQNLTIIVTMRNIGPLNVFPWTFTLPLHLREVSAEGAERIFCGFIRNGLAPKQKLAVNSVIENTDYVPFAAVLLGRSVGRINMVPAELKGRLLSGSPDHSAISRSLRIIVNTIGRANPEAVSCLSICSYFPGGLHVDLIFKLLPLSQTADVLLLLEELGLMTRKDAIFKAPRIVRDFVLEAHPLTHEHRSSVLTSYVEMLATLDPPAQRLNIVGIQSRRNDFFNVGALFLTTSSPDRLFIEAILAAAEHRPTAATSLRDVKQLLSRLMTRISGPIPHRWIAQCHEAIGYCLVQRGIFTDGQKRYRAAADIFRAMSDIVAASWCTLRCGQCQFALNQHFEAETSINTAHAMFTKLGNRKGIATALYALGTVCTENSRWTEAESHFNSASLLFRTLGMFVEAAESWEALDKLKSLGIETPRHRVVSFTETSTDRSNASVQAPVIGVEPETITDLLSPEAQSVFAPGLEVSHIMRQSSVESFGTFLTFESGTAIDFDEAIPEHVLAKREWLRIEEDAVSISTFNSHLM